MELCIQLGLACGNLLNDGRYEVIEGIGSGSFGNLFSALDKRKKEQYVNKIIIYIYFF